MIRINLLAPAETKKKKRQLSAGGSYGAILVLVLVLEVLGLYYWGDSKNSIIADKEQAIKKIETEIAKFQALKQQQSDLEVKIEQENQQTGIFKSLDAGRVGPANMLLYLSYLLTRPPLENRDERVVQEQIGWNTGWDTDRAWFTSLTNNGRTVDLAGKALTHKDTDEVLKRLRCALYLQDLQLVSSVQNKQRGSRKSEVGSLIDFKFRARINYDLGVGKTKAELDELEKKQAAKKSAGTKG